ncbi:unnamed protein product [Symbiodinium microadriaticum]|nr:unnamed protein product [Symbiodinium sp. KB8]CAE7842893.1 unnamed protein product [Symbiodinium microadriaticum]
MGDLAGSDCAGGGGCAAKEGGKGIAETRPVTVTPRHQSEAAEEVLGQLQSCFGGVLANKRSVVAEPSHWDRQQGRNTPSSDNRSYGSGSTVDSEDAELLRLLAKAVVRHEDTLNVLRRSTGWVFWVRSGENSILPMLADLAKTWYEKANSQEIQPNRVSLRVALLWGIMTCLKDKLAGLTQDQLAFAIRNTWADTNGGWNYQKWDAHHQALIVDTTRPPLSTPQALESLGSLLQALNGDTLTRFAATQEIRADAQGKITFNADISLRRIHQLAGPLATSGHYTVILHHSTQDGYGYIILMPGDLWELELPSILGVAHPALPDAADGDQDSSPSVHTIEATTADEAGSEGEGSEGDDADTPVATSSASASALMPSAPCGAAAGATTGSAKLESHAADSGQWSEVWNADVPTCGFAVHRLQLDSLILPQPPTPEAPEVEHLAYYVCSKGICTTRDLRKLCSLLPAQASAKRRRTSTSDGDTGRLQRSFSVGAYSMGGVQGVQNHTYTFPWTACWFTSMILAVAPLHQFSTCTLLHNVMSFKHTDSRNAPNTSNIIVPCDFWRGGQLWIADSQGSVHLDSKSGPGILRTVAYPYVRFNPTVPHATFPWSHGDRTVLVAHHARGLAALSTAQRRTLTDMGFQLLDAPCMESRDAESHHSC